MFVDEIKTKLGLDDVWNESVVVVFDSKYAVVSGVKKVLETSAGKVRFKFKKGSVEVTGENLEIVEIGGESAYVKGVIHNVASV